MSCAEHKKSTGTRDISQAGAAKDASSANDGPQKSGTWFESTAKHLRETGGGNGASIFCSRQSGIMTRCFDEDAKHLVDFVNNIGSKIEEICSSESFADIERLSRRPGFPPCLIR